MTDDDKIKKLQAQVKKLKEENEEWNRSFDLYHSATMRGTILYRALNPDYPVLKYPDTGKMIECLCDTIETQKKEVKELKSYIALAATVLKDVNDQQSESKRLALVLASQELIKKDTPS